jgi:hypothetical protein
MDFDKVRTQAAIKLIDAAEIADHQGCEQLARDLIRLARSVRGSTDHGDLADLDRADQAALG